MGKNVLNPNKGKVEPTSSPSPDFPALPDNKVLYPRNFVDASNKQFFRSDSNKPDIVDKDFTSHKFVDVNGFGVTFRNCYFSYSVFDRAYFRNAKFTNCSFIGCVFLNSNLRGAYFESCDLRYARFKETLLSVESIVKTLPLEPSIRRELLQNLRINARSIGDERGVKLFIREELRAEREHYKKSRERKEDYYARKYSGRGNWIKVRNKSVVLWLDYHIWGHGEHPYNLMKFVFTALIVYSIIVLFLSNQLSSASSIKQLSVFLYNSFLATTCIFIGINNSTSVSVNLLLSFAIVITRYIALGLFVSMLFRSLSKR